jgi:hypothetical protein
VADPNAAVLARMGELMAEYQLDPLGLVYAIYPWGELGELAEESGPRDWQIEALSDIGDRLRAGYDPAAAMMPVLKAISSGHGIGKSTLFAWLAWWGVSTMVDARVLITANTEAQLRTRTWPEVVKWTRLASNAAMFKVQGLRIHSVEPGHSENWRCDAVTWSETNLVAFQGLHNLGRRLVLLFEEASGIADAVWTTAEGSLTDLNTEIVWVAIGNPTEPTGRFAECFGAQRARWHGKQIDSRTVPGTNLAQAAEWVALYGEDHDFVRVRVRGMFPRSGSMQFISSEAVELARTREPQSLLTDPLIAGLDVARSLAGDQSVLRFRKGRDARTIPPIKWRTDNLMNIAGAVAEQCELLRVNQLFVDEGGVGGGVVDRLRQLGVDCIGIMFGAVSDRINYVGAMAQYANKRTEMWGNMREWLIGGAIDEDPELLADLVGPQYDFIVKAGRDAIMLERKKDMKARGLSSPDDGDALALTFAYPVAPRAIADAGRLGIPQAASGGFLGDYDPYATG